MPISIQVDIVRLCEALQTQAQAAAQLVNDDANPVTLQANYTTSILLFRLSTALALAATSPITEASPQEESA